MTVEIRELIIRAVVAEDDNKSGGPSNGEIIQRSLEETLEILDKEKER